MYLNMKFTLGEAWASQTQREMTEFGQVHRTELGKSSHQGVFPRELYFEMGKRGWIGPLVPASEGGLGGGIAEYCLISEEVARNGLISPQISIQGQRWLLEWGTEEQRSRYLSGIASGEIIFCEAISEPDAASSLRALTARARRDGSDWILNARKTHVNLGCQSDVALVYANADDDGLTAFLVDMKADGITSRQTDPIGLRLLPTAEIDFEDVRVPASAVLGEVGGGLDTFLTTFNVSRLGNASELIGFARRALANSIAYAKNRPVGKSVVTDFQGVQWVVADCYSDIYAASLARDHAANVADGHGDPSLATTLAKKLAIEAAERTINECFTLVGSHGLYTDTDFGQLLQDLKVYRVAGGSLEILRNFLARRILRAPEDEGLAEVT